MPFMIKDLNICCLWYLKSTVSTLYLILEKYRFFIPGFQVTDFEFLQAKGLCVCFFFFLNRLLINFAWSKRLFPPIISHSVYSVYDILLKCYKTLQACIQIVNLSLYWDFFPHHQVHTGYIYGQLVLSTLFAVSPL